MNARSLALHAFCLAACAVVSAEDLPRFYEAGDLGAAQAFALEKSADLRANFAPLNERFDIGVGEVVRDVYSPRTFSFAELEHFWQSQAAGRFVCLTLDKNNLGKEQRDKLVSRLSSYLFKCGVRRVRIHEGASIGVTVLFDQERK